MVRGSEENGTKTKGSTKVFKIKILKLVYNVLAFKTKVIG